ncbi:lipid A deacylase LpxR family protein [Rhodospira trueperi]|uniref:Lipid A deacylase LpxR family protein n=1 Tax=Rhodospira trueperi TaxID=69960 RepID=A0A1G7CKI7_9PROT|nr:lipid A deacylase LpxR family protein [Rhodospira trueperi]SDE39751.1 hypothetical protein SAMN05421720_106116 [Rhodospira trueperi]
MPWFSTLRVLSLIGLGLGLAAPAFADAGDDGAIVTFQLENDSFANTDRNYTNGVVIGYSPAMRDTPWADDLAAFLPLMSAYGRERVLFSLGQTMFTPSDITIREPQPDEHPWAGFLFGSMELFSEAEHHLDQMSLTVGMVGPAAQAGITQTIVHDIMHVARPRGWDNQLDNEPVVNLGYKRSWPGAARAEPLGLEMDLTPHVGAAFGNAYIHANAGAMVRLGQSLRVDAGPPLIGPSRPGTAVFDPGADDGWYVFAGIEGRAVARDIFLDGNTFGDGSPRVDKNPLVGEVRAGVQFFFNNVRVGYTHVLGTKTFDTQNGLTNHGAVSIAIGF